MLSRLDYGESDVPDSMHCCERSPNGQKNQLRDPGIEPGSVPWQGTILPLNQPRRIHG